MRLKHLLAEMENLKNVEMFVDISVFHAACLNKDSMQDFFIFMR